MLYGRDAEMLKQLQAEEDAEEEEETVLSCFHVCVCWEAVIAVAKVSWCVTCRRSESSCGVGSAAVLTHRSLQR